jgi:hypothetical protein
MVSPGALLLRVRQGANQPVAERCPVAALESAMPVTFMGRPGPISSSVINHAPGPTHVNSRRCYAWPGKKGLAAATLQIQAICAPAPSESASKKTAKIRHSTRPRLPPSQAKPNTLRDKLAGHESSSWPPRQQ